MLTEYIEPYPPLIASPGMNTLITNYYRRQSVDDDTTPPPQPLGGHTVLNVKDESPLLLGTNWCWSDACCV